MRHFFSLVFLSFTLSLQSFAQNEEGDVMPKEFEWVLYDLYFTNGVIHPETESQFQELVDFMDKTDTLFVMEGHTDLRGSDRYCLKLSECYSSYFSWLIKERLKDCDQLIRSVGYGNRKPYIAHPQNEAEQALNLRLVVRFATEEEVWSYKKNKEPDQ